MKKIQLLYVFLFSLVLTNCQKEEEEIITQPPTPDNIVVGSQLAKLLTRTAQNPTQCDNVIDGNSCFSVQLPVTVTVNGTQVNVTSEAGYQTVQDIKDVYTTDNDIVYFTYPIILKYKNFDSQVITNYTEFHNVVLSCPSDDGLNEIDCISINYPVVINIYNTNNQVANTLTVQNNKQMYNFINDLTPNVIATIVYPISGTDSNGQNVTISSNDELENFIESSIDDCGDDVGSGNATFTEVITSGSWHVTYFDHDGEIETSSYIGYNFTYNSNNTVTVVKNSASTSGTWSFYTDSSYNKLDLNFNDSNLEELNEDWTILEYTESVIRLKHASGGGGEIHYLNFTKN
jgi:hypothetical protein